MNPYLPNNNHKLITSFNIIFGKVFMWSYSTRGSHIDKSALYIHFIVLLAGHLPLFVFYSSATTIICMITLGGTVTHIPNHFLSIQTTENSLSIGCTGNSGWQYA